MINEENTGIVQMLNSLSSECLSNEAYCHYHRAVLKLIANVLETETLFLSANLYCQYKDYVELADKAYQKAQSDNLRDLSYSDAKEMYINYRIQTEIHYATLCQILVLRYHKTVVAEERDMLCTLIEDINEIIQDMG